VFYQIKKRESWLAHPLRLQYKNQFILNLINLKFITHTLKTRRRGTGSKIDFCVLKFNKVEYLKMADEWFDTFLTVGKTWQVKEAEYEKEAERVYRLTEMAILDMQQNEIHQREADRDAREAERDKREAERDPDNFHDGLLKRSERKDLRDGREKERKRCKALADDRRQVEMDRREAERDKREMERDRLLNPRTDEDFSSVCVDVELEDDDYLLHTIQCSLQDHEWKASLKEDVDALLTSITQQIPWDSYQHYNQWRIDELKMQIEEGVSRIVQTSDEVPLALRHIFAINEMGSSNPDQSIFGYIYLFTYKTVYQFTMFKKDVVLHDSNTGKWIMHSLSVNHHVASAGKMSYGTYYGFVPIAKIASIDLFGALSHLWGYVGKSSNTFHSAYYEENLKMLQKNMDKIHETVLTLMNYGQDS